LGNPQKIKFKDIEEFLASLPADELKIVELLRSIIFDCIPGCREKLSYNVPFYYGHSRLCFIWPASVPWGGIKEGVALGFLKGDKLLLPKLEGRKSLSREVFTSVNEIDINYITQLLLEVAIIDKGGLSY
jgi:hypothetical protein